MENYQELRRPIKYILPKQKQLLKILSFYPPKIETNHKKRKPCNI